MPLPLVDRTEREWLGMLSLRHYEIWTPRIMRTLATNRVGPSHLADADLRALVLALQVKGKV
jgi:hypothetical protein